MLSTTSSNILIYAAMHGRRRQKVQHGHQLLSDALDQLVVQGRAGQAGP
jgi:arginine decarboxylase